MTVKIRLFARVREVIGEECCFLELPKGSTVAEVRQALGSRYPDAIGLIAKCAMAVNCEFGSDEQVVDAPDEIAVIPPVSGGACQ